MKITHPLSNFHINLRVYNPTHTNADSNYVSQVITIVIGERSRESKANIRECITKRNKSFTFASVDQNPMVKVKRRIIKDVEKIGRAHV